MTYTLRVNLDERDVDVAVKKVETGTKESLQFGGVHFSIYCPGDARDHRAPQQGIKSAA